MIIWLWLVFFGLMIIAEWFGPAEFCFGCTTKFIDRVATVLQFASLLNAIFIPVLAYNLTLRQSNKQRILFIILSAIAGFLLVIFGEFSALVAISRNVPF